MTKDSKRIYEDLLNQIIRFERKPGERISENELSAQYQLSRTPLRDVLKQLESDGLLSIRSKSGNYVSKISLHGITDVMAIRSSVEYICLQDVTGKFTDKEILFLKKNLKKQEEYILHPKGEKLKVISLLLDLDDEFHKVIYKKAGEESMIDLLNQSFPNYKRFRVLTFLREDRDLRNLLNIHSGIVAYLEEPSSQNLESLVKNHNYSGLNGIDMVKKTYPEYFEED